MQAFVHYIALIVSLTPSSWAGFAMATIHEDTFGHFFVISFVISFFIPFLLAAWNVIESVTTSKERVPLSLVVSGLYGLCNYGIWVFIVQVDHLSIRNPKDWAGCALLCLYKRIDISLGGAALGSILAFIIQFVIANVDRSTVPSFAGFLCWQIGLAWIGSVLSPFGWLVHERGCPGDIAELQSWLLPSLDVGDGSILEASNGFVEMSTPIAIPLDAFTSPELRPPGSVVLEVRNLIKPGRQNSLVSLLRLRFPALPVEEVSGDRSFARVRVTCEHEAAAMVSIKAIAKEAGKKIDIREVPGTRRFDSPRD